jgi:phosphatidylglycerophosphate synthase
MTAARDARGAVAHGVVTSGRIASSWLPVSLAVGVACAGAVLAPLWLPLGRAYPPLAVLLIALGAFWVLVAARSGHPHSRFGSANTVTLMRAVLTVWVAALLVAPDAVQTATVAVAVGSLAAVLDGLDGRLARRSGLTSDFGARFDMETDALLVCALSVLAWRWDRAGAWVLLAGLARYLFVAAGAAWPWLRAPLPPARRRQTVCVVQIVALLIALVPGLPAPLPAVAAAIGLAALLGSFGRDVADLHRRRAQPGAMGAA